MAANPPLTTCKHPAANHQTIRLRAQELWFVKSVNTLVLFLFYDPLPSILWHVSLSNTFSTTFTFLELSPNLIHWKVHPACIGRILFARYRFEMMKKRTRLKFELLHKTVVSLAVVWACRAFYLLTHSVRDSHWKLTSDCSSHNLCVAVQMNARRIVWTV